MGSPDQPAGDNDHEHVINEPRNSPGNSAEPVPERNRRHESPEEEEQRDSSEGLRRGSMERSRPSDARSYEGTTTDGEVDGQAELFQAGAYREEFHYRSSPIVPHEELQGYKEVNPDYPDLVLGWSGDIIAAKLRDQGRYSFADMFSSIVSSIGIPIVQLGSIAATVWLGIEGQPWPATLASTPALAITISQLTIVIRSKQNQPDSPEE